MPCSAASLGWRMLSPMNSESIACQSLADKGKTAVIALMDDVVTDIILW